LEPIQAVPEWLKEISSTSELSDLDNEILPSWAKSSPDSVESKNPDDSAQILESNIQSSNAPLEEQTSPEQFDKFNVPSEPVSTSDEFTKDQIPEGSSTSEETPSVNPLDSWLDNLNKEQPLENPAPAASQEGATSFNDFLQNPQTLPS